MIRQFQWATDDNGNDGWCPMWWKDAWASDARLVAHDTLEHPLSMINSVENELMAFGAIWFGRGEQGDLQSAYRPLHDSLAGDCASVLDDIDNYGKTLTNPGRTRMLEDEGMLRVMAYDGVVKHLQWGNLGDSTDDDLTPQEQWTRDHPHAAEYTLGWLRKGYRWAQRRYKYGYRLSDLFGEVHRQVEAVGKHEEGTILTVQAKLDESCAVRVTTRHPVFGSDY